MSATIDARLADLGITLPDAAAPAANYVPFVRAGALLHVSGQLPRAEDGTLVTGRLGAELGVPEGQAAARLCALHLLAQVRAACDGDLHAVSRVVKLGAFVNSTPDFTDQPQVVNGASDLMVAVLGAAGRHARSAVGCPSLPFGVAVEIDAVFELK